MRTKPQKRKYVVRVPVTVTVCVEVRASCKDAAIREANETLPELIPLFYGIGGNDLDRPPMLGAGDTEGGDAGWFEDCDQCELFLQNGVTVKRQ